MICKISYFITIAFVFMTLIPELRGYHQILGNAQYHCWLVDGANKTNMFPCRHAKLKWIQKPPASVIQDEVFYVQYELQLDGDGTKYFEWLIENGWMDAAENSVEKAKAFCKQKCGDPTDADQDNCCVHHINIHSCPEEAIERSDDMCGPWIMPKGSIYVHTPAEASELRVWNTSVVLGNEGTNTIIAHLRVGGIQYALGQKIQVHPKANCGDGFCDNRTESCNTCKEDCCPGLKLEIKIVIIVIASLLFLAIITIPAVWYYQKQKFLYDESWIIPWDKVKPAIGYKGFGSVKSITSMMSLENGDNKDNMVRGQVFSETGIFEGKLVSIKKVYKASFQLNHNARIEVRNMRQLDHTNVARFIGIVIELENFAILSEYCNKGSLNDVLLNDEIPLNWGFRLSFASDICRGMEYLHNHKMYHGRLKSSNCIIDDRWVCKLTDFGLRNIRRADQDPELGEQYGLQREKRINRVYRPPEANADESQIYLPTTDIYSFAIILVEIGARTEISPPEEQVYDPLWRPDLPDLSEAGADPDNRLPEASKYLDLIRRCWDERPAIRPPFSDIKKELYVINPNKENPVDMMMKLMEKYSKHLESLVTERTKELIEEKKKTDRLLYAMLPQSVAEELKQGRQVTAKKYATSTIFFSDIVGFTSLSSTSTPMEVVELLNAMYTAFDSIIDDHDVYKVETIGDAYMVVSGVPQENGLKHAEEIAEMAIKIVCFCRGFRVPHRPDQIVNIRAGIHSGPVVTCVVGLKMPRFCLFGDTVNMASRMESTGQALKVQVSPDTHEILKTNPEFHMEYRGEIEIKGKGTKKTHWLLGRGQRMISTCLSPSTHKRIFKGANVPPPNPLRPDSSPVNSAAVVRPKSPKKLPPLHHLTNNTNNTNPKKDINDVLVNGLNNGGPATTTAPVYTLDNNNNNNSSSVPSPPPPSYDYTFSRDDPYRDSTTSRDALLDTHV